MRKSNILAFVFSFPWNDHTLHWNSLSLDPKTGQDRHKREFRAENPGFDGIRPDSTGMPMHFLPPNVCTMTNLISRDPWIIMVRSSMAKSCSARICQALHLCCAPQVIHFPAYFWKPDVRLEEIRALIIYYLETEGVFSHCATGVTKTLRQLSLFSGDHMSVVVCLYQTPHPKSEKK